jgi:hypothetical protein
MELPTYTVSDDTLTSTTTGFTLIVPFTVTLPLPVGLVPLRCTVTDAVPPALTSNLAEPVKVVLASAELAVSVIV